MARAENFTLHVSGMSGYWVIDALSGSAWDMKRPMEATKKIQDALYSQAFQKP